MTRDAPIWGGLLGAVAILLSLTPAARAQDVSPPPPTAPEVVTRAVDGRTTVRATRLAEPLRLDGRLDEEVYRTVPPITGLVQQIPDEGAPATERTEMWVLFDERAIYVVARCHESTPESEWVANEMRHDVIQLRQNDSFSLLLDTFFDRRNGVAFLVTPIGGFSDFAITNEGNVNTDWNTVWDARTGRFEGGWTVEIEIPFKSLRYRPGTEQVWGLQLRRIIRRRNEASYLTPLPISAARGNSVIAGLWRVSEAATLVGVEAPPPSLNAEIKPYAIAGLTTDRTTDPAIDNDGSADAGLDLKYNVTRNLTADVTFNTDFAQVEVDERQINLTRFSLFFPEKREFFLEGRGNFDFARGAAGDAGVGAPTVFFSRRIGLQGGQVVPIRAGGRLTGKVGAFDIGALNIQTGDESVSGARPTNFTVLRLKKDVLRRSTVGAILTSRSRSLLGEGASRAYGVDGRFAFLDDLTVTGYAARAETPLLATDDESYQARLDYAGDRYGLGLEHLMVGGAFVPEIGFVPRDDFRRSSASVRFSPRPRSLERVRRFVVQASVDYIEQASTGLLETRQRTGLLETELENSDRVSLLVVDRFESLTEPFTIAPGVILPVRRYDFRDVRLSYAFGAQRPVSGTVTLQRGGFWSGDNTALSVSRGRIEVTPQLSVEPSVSFNWVELPEGSFTTRLVRTRLTYTFTPRMFVSGLLQYSSAGDSFSTNVRFRWRYSPGSELFVVYTEHLDTDPLDPRRRTELRNRGLVVKINRLLRL